MSNIFTLEEMLDEKNETIYHEIESKYPIIFKENSDKCWASHLQNGKVTIWTYDTKYPGASLSHELLHIKVQIDGYKRIYTGIAIDNQILVQGYLGYLISALDNEFQHHKMYDEFIKMGYDGEEFYEDSDAQLIANLENKLSQKKYYLEDLSLQYLSLIAPGGKIPFDKVKELKQKFFSINNSLYSNNFKVIDNIINNWKSTDSYNAEPYIKEFLMNIDCGRVWISYHQSSDPNIKFPESGFFVNETFDEFDMEKADNKESVNRKKNEQKKLIEKKKKQKNKVKKSIAKKAKKANRKRKK